MRQNTISSHALHPEMGVWRLNPETFLEVAPSKSLENATLFAFMTGFCTKKEKLVPQSDFLKFSTLKHDKQKAAARSKVRLMSGYLGAGPLRDFCGPGEKRKRRPPATKLSRKLSGFRN